MKQYHAEIRNANSVSLNKNTTKEQRPITGAYLGAKKGLN